MLLPYCKDLTEVLLALGLNLLFSCARRRSTENRCLRHEEVHVEERRTKGHLDRPSSVVTCYASLCSD